MAKYILNIPDEILEFMNGKFNFFIEPEVKVGECRHYKVRLDDTEITPYTEPDRKAIEDEVWEFVRKIVIEMECSERYDCFGDDNEVFVIGTYSYKEVKEKYEAWLKNKDEICVGDEVIPLDTQYNTMVVTKLWVSEYGDEWVDTIADDGKTYNFLKTSIKKTGRHFDGVEKLLEEMSEETE